MKTYKFLLLALVFALLPPVSDAKSASTSLSIIINSAPSTALTCPISYPTGQTAFTTPVAAGTVIAVCTVTPPSWSGALALSGPDAGSFALSGLNLVVGATAISTPKTYNVTLTATP